MVIQPEPLVSGPMVGPLPVHTGLLLPGEEPHVQPDGHTAVQLQPEQPAELANGDAAYTQANCPLVHVGSEDAAAGSAKASRSRVPGRAPPGGLWDRGTTAASLPAFMVLVTWRGPREAHLASGPTPSASPR